MRTLRIAERIVGDDHEPYVIAEIGVNHDGSPARAIELVDAAADAGASAVKVQLFRAGMLLSRDAGLAAYQKDAGESDASGMLARLELDEAALSAVAERARARGLHAIATVFSTELVRTAEAIGFDAYKTASPDLVHRPLLERLVETGRPLIVSTGAATEDEVLSALEWLAPAADRLALLQCVSRYPTPAESAALGGITALRARFTGPVGYSDHTTDEHTGALAVACGASILEKHLTHSRKARGPDHRASLEPDALARYIRQASTAHRAVGPRAKVLQDGEHEVRSLSRQSVCAARPLLPGETISEQDLCYRRPGLGIPPASTGSLVGRRVARPVDRHAHLAESDIEPERAPAAAPSGQ